MAEESFYRKFRPTQLQTVVGQRVVVQSLLKAAKKERFAHAYLLTGPKGTGKTTVARIIAALVTCPERKPNTEVACGKCRSCRGIHAGNFIDVYEIDAASEGGVDEVRELKKSTSYAPNTLKMKVYIIDEAHQLTPAANNALLKVLEEPPPYVMFILCTTDPQKLLGTVVSRCQRHQLKRIDAQDIADRIKVVAEHEKIQLETGVDLRIAKMAKGSMRDAYGILEQISIATDNKVGITDINTYYGQPEGRLIYSITKMILDKNVSGALLASNECYLAGVDPKAVLMELSNVLADLLHIKGGVGDVLVQADLEEKKLLVTLAEKISQRTLVRIVGSLNKIERDITVNMNERLVLDAALINCILIIQSDERPATSPVNNVLAGTPVSQ